MGTVARRSCMTLFSDGLSHYSHRVRIVLAEKGVSVDVVDGRQHAPDDLSEFNPYNALPLLVDRDLVLYESKIMMEYLDERFPHPPLLPAYPVTRSECRQLIYRIERDWCGLVDALGHGGDKEGAGARRALHDHLSGIAPIFAGKPYFMSDEFTLVDCCMAPILWRLPMLGVDITATKETQPLLDYRQRLFSRPSFKASLSPQELAMDASRAA